MTGTGFRGLPTLIPWQLDKTGEVMTERSKPRRIPLEKLTFQPRFAYGDQAQIAEMTGAGDGTTLGTGFAHFNKADIPWTVKYDEVLLVIEGRLTVKTQEAEFVLEPLDSLWLPKGTDLHYRSDSTLVFYAIHPSNWADSET